MEPWVPESGSYATNLTNRQWALVADLFDPQGRRGAPARLPRRSRSTPCNTRRKRTLFVEYRPAHRRPGGQRQTHDSKAGRFLCDTALSEPCSARPLRVPAVAIVCFLLAAGGGFGLLATILWTDRHR